MATFESLKKISYENLKQFTEDINANFAIIQNSPLYKGIPGEQGTSGKAGDKGERGSHFYFIKLEKFLQQYPDEIINGSQITIEWLNAKLNTSNNKEKLKLLNTLGIVGELVNNDIVVLTSSEMIEYDAAGYVFVPTGISFYQKGSLITSIEQKIEDYVIFYVNNNSIINSLRNIFIDYVTYNTLPAQSANTYITNNESINGMYLPSIDGVGINTGSLVENHKYFGYNRNVIESGKKSTNVLGSIDDYLTILQNTVKETEKNSTITDYVPNEKCLPTLIVLQNTDNNGILFGYYNKGTAIDCKLSYFGSLFKDNDRIVHLKSDQGNNETDFSELLLHRHWFKYNKRVYFGDNLIVGKDFQLDGNFNNRWFRTAEFIKSKYKNSNIEEQKSKIIEVGLVNEIGDLFGAEEFKTSDLGPLYTSKCIYRNISKQIELPAFSDITERVVLTVAKHNDKTGEGAELCKDYFIETKYTNISSLNNNNLNDIEWSPSVKNENYLVTSKHLNELITKVNYIQQFIKENYWLRKEWKSTDRGENNRIPLLNVNELDVYSDSNLGNNTNNYLKSTISEKKLILGFNNGTLIIRAKNGITIDYYKNLVDINNSEQNIVTTDLNGDLKKLFGIYSKYDKITLSDISKLTDDKFTKLIPTVKHIGIIASTLINDFGNYWEKSTYTKNADKKTGEDTSTTLEAGNIPNLYVKNLLGGKVLEILNNNVKFKVADKTLLECNEFEIITTNLILNSQNIKLSKLTSNKILSLNNDKKVVTEYEIFNNTYIVKTDYSKEVILNESITDANKKILTAADWLKLNSRINNILTKVNEDYWTKNEFAPIDKNNLPKATIPKLYLKSQFILDNTIDIQATSESNDKVIEYDGTSLRIGQNNINYNTILKSPNIYFDKWNKQSNELTNKVLVTDKDGKLVKTYFISESPEEKIIGKEINNDKIVIKDTEVPKDTDSRNKDNNGNEVDDVRLNEIKSQTVDEHHIITGKQWKWLQSFINNVKLRFKNTFNKKETIDYVYDHMPVGSIILWTKESADLAEKSKINLNDQRIPYGWAICDGHSENGVILPDFTDRFILAVSKINETFEDDFKGGGGNTKDKNNYVILSENNLPLLEHLNEYKGIKFEIDIENGKEKTDKKNSNKLNTNNDGNHSHNINIDNLPTNKIFNIPDAAISFDTHKSGSRYKSRCISQGSANGNHLRLNDLFSKAIFSINNDGNHKHNIDLASHGFYNPTPINITPKYYKAIYIMKVDTRNGKFLTKNNFNVKNNNGVWEYIDKRVDLIE